MTPKVFSRRWADIDGPLSLELNLDPLNLDPLNLDPWVYQSFRSWPSCNQPPPLEAHRNWVGDMGCEVQYQRWYLVVTGRGTLRIRCVRRDLQPSL